MRQTAIWSLVLLLAMGMFLAACSGAAENGEGTGTEENGTAESGEGDATDEGAADDEAGGNITLAYVNWDLEIAKSPRPAKSAGRRRI